MTLLNGILALGALAFSVPLVIHLLFRSRFRTIDWGAMHLLDGVVRINRRRIQLLNLLLLLLRCMVPVLLAFCLARPLLTGFQSLPGDEPQTLVIAVDDSRSMSARDETGLTRMDIAKQGLASLLAKLTRRDEVMVVRSSNVGAPAAAQGAQEAMRRIRELRSDFGPVDLGTLMRAAVEAAESGSHPQRRIVVVGDFPSHIVEDASMASLSRVAASLEEKAIRPVVSFWNLGVESNQLENVSVDSVEIDSPALVAGRDATFSAEIRNASDLPIRDLRVVWTADGKELDPTSVTIAPRSSVTSRLSHPIDEAGVRQLTVAVEHADALIADNRRSIAMDVINEIDVVLVDGQPSREPLESETDYLAVALSPFAFGGEDQPDAVRTSVIRTNQLVNELRERGPDILVLANVESVRGEIRNSISEFVLQGGALVVFDGGNLNVESYNQPWASDLGTWSLPARLGDLVVGRADGSEDTPGQDRELFQIAGRNPNYSAWDVLGSREQQPFADVELYQYRRLALGSPDANERKTESTNSDATEMGVESASEPDDSSLALWNLANGDPLAISARRGRGRIVQFAIGCDASWTTLPMRMVYLPMMQQLVLDLAGSRREATLYVGDGFSVPVSELSALIPGDAERAENEEPTFTIEPPNEPEFKLRPSDEALPQLTLARTSAVGPYRIRQSTPLQDGSDEVVGTMRVVDVPPIESRLRDADPARLAAAADLMDANVYTDLSALQSDDRTRRFGREIWRWLLGLLLIVLVAELWLQQRSARAMRIPTRPSESSRSPNTNLPASNMGAS